VTMPRAASPGMVRSCCEKKGPLAWTFFRWPLRTIHLRTAALPYSIGYAGVKVKRRSASYSPIPGANADSLHRVPRSADTHAKKPSLRSVTCLRRPRRATQQPQIASRQSSIGLFGHAYRARIAYRTGV